MVAVVVAELSKTGPAEVQRVLRDWSGAGLIGDTIWLDAAAVGGTNLGRHVSGSVSTIVRVTDWFPEHPNDPPAVCLFDLHGYGGEPGMADAEELAERVRKAFGEVPLRVIAAPEDMTTVPVAALPASTEAIIVSCADASSPGAMAAERRSDDPRFPAQVAAGLAGVAGLWRWTQKRPDGFGGQAVGGGVATARVARAFTRVIDSRPLFQGVLSGIKAVIGDELPVAIAVSSTGEARELPRLDAAGAAVATEKAAEAVLEVNGEITRFTKPAWSGKDGPTPISFLQAVKHYLSYLWDALRQAPAQLARAVVYEAQKRVAQAGQSLPGADSVFKVVATQRQAVLAGKLGQTLAAPAVDILRHDDRNWRPAPPEAGVLWQDVFHVACALVDGSDVESDQLARDMPHEGSAPMVVTRAASIAPNPDGPPFTAAFGPSEHIELDPCDPLAALSLKDTLTEAVRSEPDPEQRGALSAVLGRLDAWIGRQQSFAWEVGWRIATSLRDATRMLAAINRGPEESEAAMQARLEKALRKLRVRSIVLLILTILGLVGVGFVTGLGFITWPIAVAIGAGWLLVMFISAVLACTRLIDVRYKIENARRVDEFVKDQEQTQTRHRLAGDVHRLGGVADQSAAWVRLLGELVHHVGGLASLDSAAAQGTVLVGRLPLAMQVAKVEYAPEANGKAVKAHLALAYSARTELLAPGWFGQLAETRLKSAGELWCAQRSLDEATILAHLVGAKAQEAQGALTAVMARLPEPANRNQSTLDEQLMQWAQQNGRPQWQAASESAQMVAGVDTAFDSKTFFTSVVADPPRPVATDFSQVGVGMNLHGQLADAGAPVAVGMAERPGLDVQPTPSGMDGFLQAVCRVIASPSVPAEMLHCFEGSAGAVVPPPQPDQPPETTSRLIPRFSEDE